MPRAQSASASQRRWRLGRGPWAWGAALLLLASVAGSGAVVRRSPRERVALALGSATIAVEYGRPLLAGRQIWGVLVPWGEVWRAGDDEATVLATDAPVRLGSLLVPAGRYAVFLRPDTANTTLILNRQPDQWGAFNREPRLDLGSLSLETTSTATPIERFSIVLEPVGERSGRLWIGWETTVWVAELELAEAARGIENPTLTKTLLPGRFWSLDSLK